MSATSNKFIFRVVLAILFAGMLVTGAAAQSPPTIAKAFSSATVGLNQSVTLTFTITNPNPATDLTGVSFSDDMPAGLLIANPDSLGGDCDTSVVTLSSTNISLNGATLLANTSCSLSIDVLATAAGDQVNTTGAITSVEGGTGGTATATVTVVVPDLTVAMSHPGNFFRPEMGATYTITVSNSGAADTSALITVNFNLPSGITASALGGPNWNCALTPLQCTRGDTLFAGTSFEDITLTVNVGISAPASFTASASVSGGNESNTANDTATDPTQTVAALVLGVQSASASVTTGGTVNTTLNITANSATLGAITFACGGLPAGATCTFNPASVTTSGPVTMTIATTAKSTIFPPQPPGRLPPTLLLVLCGLAVLAISQLHGRRLRLAGAMASLALLTVAGCGVNRSTPVQHNPGTPPGTYAVTVTASSANQGATATGTLNLTVQ
jgi:uncharacterized repeat protein (TIGR01451 family)